jgi:pyridoxal phosphate enzyme (YggS family)
VGRTDKLNILIQVNTSGEESKSGCEPADCVDLVAWVVDNCPHLQVKGLMTIGQYEAEPSATFFKRLAECKEAVCAKLPELSNGFQLSMGMSHDYDLAVQHGSTEVRVGTAIFGPRSYIKTNDDE